MSSPFQSAGPAEIQSQDVPEQKKPESPYQELIDQVTALIMTMNSLPEKEQSDFLWKFMSNYITLLEKNKHYLLPILAKVYPKHVRVTDNLVKALVSIRDPKSVAEMLDFINSISDEHLGPQEKELLGILKLQTPQGPFLVAFTNVVGKLPPEEASKLDQLFLNELKKYKPQKENSSLMEKNVPGTGIKIKWVLIVLVILVILGLLGYFFFCRNSSSKRELNFRGIESDFSE